MKFNEYVEIINESIEKCNFNVEDYFVINHNKKYIEFDANEYDEPDVYDCLREQCEIIDEGSFYTIFKLEDGIVEVGYEW